MKAKERNLRSLVMRSDGSVMRIKVKGKMGYMRSNSGEGAGLWMKTREDWTKVGKMSPWAQDRKSK